MQIDRRRVLLSCLTVLGVALTQATARGGSLCPADTQGSGGYSPCEMMAPVDSVAQGIETGSQSLAAVAEASLLPTGGLGYSDAGLATGGIVLLGYAESGEAAAQDDLSLAVAWDLSRDETGPTLSAR